MTPPILMSTPPSSLAASYGRSTVAFRTFPDEFLFVIPRNEESLAILRCFVPQHDSGRSLGVTSASARLAFRVTRARAKFSHKTQNPLSALLRAREKKNVSALFHDHPSSWVKRKVLTIGGSISHHLSYLRVSDTRKHGHST